MLVLTQRDGDEVTIRDPEGAVLGQVTLVRASGGRARIGFQFPASFAINRRDVDEQKYKAPMKSSQA